MSMVYDGVSIVKMMDVSIKKELCPRCPRKR